LKVPRVLAQLKTNNKVARATHNIVAWRLVQPRPAAQDFALGPLVQCDCDSDGQFLIFLGFLAYFKF
jgi:hypothetical protein